MLLQRLSPTKEKGQMRPLPSRRSPMMLVVGVALTALGALVAWQVYGFASQRVPVLVVARDVPIGQQIQAQDLRTVALGVDTTVQSVDAAGKSALIGRRAAVDLKAGSLLSPAHVTETLVPAPGEVVVPVALKPSRLPARGIQPGDRVVATAVSSGDAGRGPAQDHQARVDRVGQPDADGLVVVDLIVPAAAGPALARQAAEGLVAIVLQSRAG
ncbi:SAF domain-containing protein [Nonomuraea sp. NPDC050404]|uniref:SAF domain-containing protein n=1 Tax=Nonomuraea sp. NPDC050404 TaxID=3155783 RepID=UPI00340AD3FC